MPDRDTESEPTRDTATDRQALARIPETVSSALGTAVGTAVEAAGEALQVAGQAVEAAGRRWRERPGQRVRRVRRMARESLPNLYDLYPEARRAVPRELGLRTIAVDEIRGTAVAGHAQRGGDFLPLRPFRSRNWAGRWQRVRRAVDGLATLPPIDAVRYDDGYWVTDGHNRVAAALYAGQVEIDATVIELIPPGGRSTERPGVIGPAVLESRALRTAASGAPPSGLVALDDRTGGPLDAHDDGGDDPAAPDDARGEDRRS